MSQELVMQQLQEAVAKGEETVGDWLTVDQARIDKFADATEDHQWIHVDPDRAAQDSPYKTTIAHGYLTLSLLPALTGSVKAGGSGFPGVKMGVNYGLNKVRFPAPVKVNSRVRTRRKIKEVSEVAGGLQIIGEVTVEVEGAEKPCCVAETLSRFYF